MAPEAAYAFMLAVIAWIFALLGVSY